MADGDRDWEDHYGDLDKDEEDNPWVGTPPDEPEHRP